MCCPYPCWAVRQQWTLCHTHHQHRLSCDVLTSACPRPLFVLPACAASPFLAAAKDAEVQAAQQLLDEYFSVGQKRQQELGAAATANAAAAGDSTAAAGGDGSDEGEPEGEEEGGSQQQRRQKRRKATFEEEVSALLLF